MNYSFVSKQNQDVWLAENPDIRKVLLKQKQLPMWEGHRNSIEASMCLYNAYIIDNIKNEYEFCSLYYFNYRKLQAKYVIIANMYSSVFVYKYSKEEIGLKWKELINYAESNNLKYL
jgi:hypothetical protein